MKNLIRFCMLAVVMMTVSVNTFAQKAERRQGNAKPSAEGRAQQIAKEIALDDATTKKFVEVYSQYKNEMRTLGARSQQRTGTRSDAETKEAMKENLDREQKVLDLRKKYHEEFSKFLTPKQLEKVYELDAKRPGGQRPQTGGRP